MSDKKLFPGQVDPATESYSPDLINHPPHYTLHPSGVECIDITEHMNFCIGNAIKYLWRSGNKGSADDEIQDLKKAIWYINREIERLEKIPVPECQVRVSGVPYGVDKEALQKMQSADDGD